MQSNIYGLATSKKVKFAQRQAPSENRVSKVKFRQKHRTSINAPKTVICVIPNEMRQNVADTHRMQEIITKSMGAIAKSRLIPKRKGAL